MNETQIELTAIKLPEPDLVKVVRCKDCKWYREGEYLAPTKFCFRLKHPHEDRHVGYNFSSNDYCSRGVRKSFEGVNNMSEKKVYVHYGAKEYDREKFRPIKNVSRNVTFTKPREGGLWASPVDAEHGWKDWCKDNEFRVCSTENSFRFQLKDGTKILRLFTCDDLEGLPHNTDTAFELEYMSPSRVCLDFEELVRMGYDAVEVECIENLYHALYGWDCDSILVMNPDVIEEVE